ncbi:hypothetical protein ACFL2V_07955 [Pseudomonadota bacterium]
MHKSLGIILNDAHIAIVSKIQWGSDLFEMSVLGIRRAKAVLTSWVPHPATAPFESNRSNCGGNEMVEAFGVVAG